MNFLALLLGLAIERLLTSVFHLREFRWLDPAFDRLLREVRRRGPWLGGAVALAGALLLTVPVLLASLLLYDEFRQIPFFLFAVVVLLFSLGPRDLEQEADDYCAALERGDEEGLRRVAKELAEEDTPNDSAARHAAVERAIYVQANNRMFGVIFWFLLLGPAGAWLFRVLDLLRRRARFQQSRPDAAAADDAEAPVRVLHGLLAWMPARLLATGYTLAGNFEDAARGWREAREPGLGFVARSEELMARVGSAASGRAPDTTEDPAEAYERLRGAMALVMRTLWLIWCPVIALLTLYDWLV